MDKGVKYHKRSFLYKQKYWSTAVKFNNIISGWD